MAPPSGCPKKHPLPSLHTRELLCTNKSFHCAAQKPEQSWVSTSPWRGSQIRTESSERTRRGWNYTDCCDIMSSVQTSFTKKGGNFYLWRQLTDHPVTSPWYYRKLLSLLFLGTGSRVILDQRYFDITNCNRNALFNYPTNAKTEISNC